MFIVWGSRGYQKRLSETEGLVHCEHCNNDVHYEAVEIGRRFTLFWIPLFTYRRQYAAVCPICGRGRSADSKAELEYLMAALSTPAPNIEE